MQKKKIKELWSKHKTKIIVGGVVTVGICGAFFAGKMIGNKQLVNRLIKIYDAEGSDFEKDWPVFCVKNNIFPDGLLYEIKAECIGD